MAQSGGGGGCGRDFQLPEEILALMPTDPYDQLDLAKRITAMAISSRVSQLEAEAEKLCQKISDRDGVIAELQDKLARLDRSFQDSEARLRATLEENSKIAKERDMLAITAKKLARDLTKLEKFKRHLMQSLSDDNLYQQSEVDIGDYRQSCAKISSWRDEESSSQSGMELGSGSPELEEVAQHGSTQTASLFSVTPYITSRLTPSSTPKYSSTGGSPRGLSTGESSPKAFSGATSPNKSRFDRRGSFSSVYPSSQKSSASSSPQRPSSQGRTPRIDGKELFRQARTRLSYEQFAAFLANVKELNAQRQSREEALAKAEEIFGIENKDLYLSFQGLLNRNIP